MFFTQFVLWILYTLVIFSKRKPCKIENPKTPSLFKTSKYSVFSDNLKKIFCNTTNQLAKKKEINLVPARKADLRIRMKRRNSDNKLEVFKEDDSNPSDIDKTEDSLVNIVFPNGQASSYEDISAHKNHEDISENKSREDENSYGSEPSTDDKLVTQLKKVHKKNNMGSIDRILSSMHKVVNEVNDIMKKTPEPLSGSSSSESDDSNDDNSNDDGNNNNKNNEDDQTPSMTYKNKNKKNRLTRPTKQIQSKHSNISPINMPAESNGKVERHTIQKTQQGDEDDLINDKINQNLKQKEKKKQEIKRKEKPKQDFKQNEKFKQEKKKPEKDNKNNLKKKNPKSSDLRTQSTISVYVEKTSDSNDDENSDYSQQEVEESEKKINNEQDEEEEEENSDADSEPTNLSAYETQWLKEVVSADLETRKHLLKSATGNLKKLLNK